MNGETVPHQNGAALGAASARPPVCDRASSGDRGSNSPTVLMVGNSSVMLEVFDQIRRFATCDVPVLLSGESGTRKDLSHMSISYASCRAEGKNGGGWLARPAPCRCRSQIGRAHV